MSANVSLIRRFRLISKGNIMVAYLDQAGVQHLIRTIRDRFWPVGTILATANNVSPASYLGGSWEAYATGRTLVGVDSRDSDFTLGKQGGEKTVHIETSTDLAAGISYDTNGNGQIAWNDPTVHSSAKYHSGFALNTRAPIDWNHREYRSGTKVYGTLSLMSPYQVVHYWRRIA
nr:MAG TPA: Baseplate wedge protein [Caudoviricetes sp.]